jgi:hypothetical protein
MIQRRKLSPRSSVYLEKLIVPQIFEKFPPFIKPATYYSVHKHPPQVHIRTSQSALQHLYREDPLQINLYFSVPQTLCASNPLTIFLNYTDSILSQPSGTADPLTKIMSHILIK